MHYRSVFLAGLLLAAGPAQLVWAQAAPAAEAPAAANGLPARPTPFRFVNDQGSLMAPAEVKKLESGLRKYADETGTQVVVVTVPTLGGREVADYGRALGNAWGVGQRGKNNGVVVLIAGQERKVTIQAGSGLQDRVTPAVVQQVIGQQFGPNFKQGNYFAGLRKGLSTLMLAANPGTDPRKDAVGSSPTAGALGGAAGAAPALNAEGSGPAVSSAQEPVGSGGGGLVTPPPPAEPSGPGLGTLALGALGIGGLIWLLMKMFRRNQTPAASNAPGGNAPNVNPNQPNFNPNQPNRPGGGAPNFLPNQGQQGGNYGPNNGPNYNNGPGFGGGGGGGLMGGGMGGMLATGAAAAAGAYLGNRMAGGGHDAVAGNELGGQQQAGLGGGLGAGAAGVGGAGLGAGAAAGDYFANRDGGAAGGAAEPDYFSDNGGAADGGGDYFSDDSGSSSYDDTSSDDFGGGGFDGGGGDDSGSF